MGENGSVVLGGVAVNRIDYWRFREETLFDKDIQRQFSQKVPNVYGHGHTPYLAHVTEAILQDKPGLVEGEEAKKTVRFLTCLYESAAMGGAAVVPGQEIMHTPLGMSAKPNRKHEETEPVAVSSRQPSRSAGRRQRHDKAPKPAVHLLK
jgi:hypothetical protein